jgi:putative ABC transport system permease protein
MLYKLSSNISTQDAVTRLTAIFNKYSPPYPFKYLFADEDYTSKYNLELLIGKLAGLFAGLAIFISCLGLFGLAAYMAEHLSHQWVSVALSPLLFRFISFNNG